MSGSRQLSTEEKEALVRRLEAGERVGALARETGVLRKSLYQVTGLRVTVGYGDTFGLHPFVETG
jgi:transposase-like protein